MRTDPAWVDSYYGVSNGDRVDIHRGFKPDGLGEAFTENFTNLTKRALEEAGATLDDISAVLVTHGNRDLHESYLDSIGVSHERSVFSYAADGHLGGSDPLLALKALEMDRTLAPGDVIVVATAGSGSAGV